MKSTSAASCSSPTLKYASRLAMKPEVDDIKSSKSNSTREANSLSPYCSNEAKYTSDRIDHSPPASSHPNHPTLNSLRLTPPSPKDVRFNENII